MTNERQSGVHRQRQLDSSRLTKDKRERVVQSQSGIRVFLCVFLHVS